MRDMTREDLQGAFAGESQAHIKYKAFADIAEREKLPNVARLFRAASFAEQLHAINHLRALGGIGKTPENLATAFAGETFEINEMYPAYIAVAKLQGEKRALSSMEDALAAEKIHATLYAAAQAAVAAGKDIEGTPVFVCDVCGWTVEGDAPDKCPICGAARTRFQQF